MPYVTDTHSLVWHMTGDPRLSKEAKEIFQKADNAEDVVFIPCIVFFELVYLTEKRRISTDFDRLLRLVSLSGNYKVEPLCLPIIERSRQVSREKVADPWDRLIVATSIHLHLPLITHDRSLRNIGLPVI